VSNNITMERIINVVLKIIIQRSISCYTISQAILKIKVMFGIGFYGNFQMYFIISYSYFHHYCIFCFFIYEFFLLPQWFNNVSFTCTLCQFLFCN